MIRVLVRDLHVERVGVWFVVGEVIAGRAVSAGLQRGAVRGVAGRLAGRGELADRAATGFAIARQGDTTKSFGIFTCSKATDEMNYAAQKFARAVMVTNNIDSCNRT